MATNASTKDDGPAKARGSPGPPGPPENQSTLRVVCLIVSAFVAMFLVALDRTIISTVCVSYNYFSTVLVLSSAQLTGHT
jgi:hypothetical protein